ncbi:MAG: Nif3-like dinuclear metal center hexameric protein [Terrimonas sp.]|nr:Nif3-like dinuclear metal center hexameric protein [Terrimonas sp.]
MKIADLIDYLETIADPSLQESYDNAGLITGLPEWECRGVLCTLDVTEEVIEEAIRNSCNLVVAHHPVIFRGIKKINGKNQVERTVIIAIKNDIAIYAIHTNLDNVMEGVNGRMAAKIGLTGLEVLAPRNNSLMKLFTFVPISHGDAVRTAIFEAGGGHIGNYSSCSFNAEGFGTFKGEAGSQPFAGTAGSLHKEAELKIEVIFPSYLQPRIIKALLAAHPYEEVAYDVINTGNLHPQLGSGLTGRLEKPVAEGEFLKLLKGIFGVPVIRHSAFTGRMIKTVAICGGAGSFMISNALGSGVDAFVTADMKYHEFFEADGKILIADVGHYESEQFTIGLLNDLLQKKFPTFAVLKTGVKTNPVYYC